MAARAKRFASTTEIVPKATTTASAARTVVKKAVKRASTEGIAASAPKQMKTSPASAEADTKPVAAAAKPRPATTAASGEIDVCYVISLVTWHLTRDGYFLKTESVNFICFHRNYF